MSNVTLESLAPENLVFNRGNPEFTKEEFVRTVKPYFSDLMRVKRTNHLCAFVYGDGSKPDVTGYATETTINVTINSRAIKAEKSGGKWAIYSLRQG